MNPKAMNSDKPLLLEITPTGTGVSIEYDNTPLVSDIGVEIPIYRQWRWSFDGSLRLLTSEAGKGKHIIAVRYCVCASVPVCTVYLPL